MRNKCVHEIIQLYNVYQNEYILVWTLILELFRAVQLAIVQASKTSFVAMTLTPVAMFLCLVGEHCVAMDACEEACTTSLTPVASSLCSPSVCCASVLD